MTRFTPLSPVPAGLLPGVDAAALKLLLGDDVGPSLAALCIPQTMLVAEIEEALAAAASAGATLRTVGRSSSGRAIRMASFGTGPVDVLLYGFVHPDEPMGALGITALLELQARPDDQPAARPLLAAARWHVIPCADPDIASVNERWNAGIDLEDMLLGSIRPEHLSREVDYGFPVQWDIFHQPAWWDGGRACRTAGSCVQPLICGAACRCYTDPVGPLPESLAIAEAIRLTQPQLVVSLHDTHTGGCYSFLMHRPTEQLVSAHGAIAGACGLPRHMGQLPDSGRRWIPQVPDLIREPTLERERKRFLRLSGADPSSGPFLGNVSAAMHLQSVLPEAEFLVPEAPHFTNSEFENTSPLSTQRRVIVRTRAGRKGLRVGVFSALPLPDGSVQEVLYHLDAPDKAPWASGAHSITMTRGMLGVEAVELRRWAFCQLDEMWDALPAGVRQVDEPYANERRSITVPGSRVSDRSLLMYRMAPYYRTPATVAQHADFMYRWRIHTAQRVGMLAAFSRLHGETKIASQAESLMRSIVASLPPELHHANRRQQGALSQLARTLLVLQHRAPN